MNDSEKLAQIRAILEAPAAPAERAYDRPQLGAGEVRADGQTINADGSRWTTSKGVPVCEIYGYISPAKTPELWKLAQDVLSPDAYMEWNAAWTRNPYGIYRADVPALLRNGTEVNLMLFSALLGQPVATVVQ